MEPLLAIFGLVLGLFGFFGLFVGADPTLVYGHLVLGGALLVFAAVRSSGRLVEVFGGGVGRGGANSLVQTVLICVIAGLVAFVSVRNPKNWDWTESGRHTLAQGTLDVLSRIPDEGVEIYGFFTQGTERQPKGLLDMYEYNSERLSVSYFDPNQRPDLAHRFEVATQEGLVLVCGGPCDTAKGIVRLAELSEQELTKAIRNVISDRRKVYVLAGHGEASLEEDQAPGLAIAKAALDAENVEVAELVLANAPEVPDDADAVLVVGPQYSLFDSELQSLDRYLRRGGGLAVFADPLVVSNLEDTLRSWGVELGNDIIVEEQRQLFAGPTLGVQPIVTRYGEHPITQVMTNRATLFNLVRSVRAADEPPGEVTELALTSQASWAESDTERFVKERAVQPDPEQDRMGPVAIAAAVEIPRGGGEGEDEAAAGNGRDGRLVVFGDSDFVRNRYLAEGSNVDLLLNAVNWLVGLEEFATIERKRPRPSTTTLTVEQFANFRFLALFVIPELVLLAGVVGWWRRRS